MESAVLHRQQRQRRLGLSLNDRARARLLRTAWPGWLSPSIRNTIPPMQNVIPTVEQELATQLPEGVEVRVVEESADTIYLVLPFASAIGEGEVLSDQELEAVAGGGETVWKDTCACPSAECGP